MDKNKWSKVGKYLLLTGIALSVLFPVVFMITNSFMGADEIKSYYDLTLESAKDKYISFEFIPAYFTLRGYYDVFLKSPDFLIKFWHSVLIVVPVVVGQVIVSAPAAYAFAKLKFPFKNGLFFIIIVMMLVPYQVTLVPNYIMLKNMGLLGSYAAIIIPGIFSAFGVFLLTQLMKSIPNEQIEAAKIDGASYFKIFTNIILPQCKGGIVTLIILSFVDCWNMVEQPLIFLDNSSQYPLSIFLAEINYGDIGIAFTCGVIYMMPAVLLFLRGEKHLIEDGKYLGIK